MQRKEILAEFRNLEETIEKQGNKILHLEEQLAAQGTEVQDMAHASMEVRAEDVEQLGDYKREVIRLMSFVEKVAQSKSKFGKEARKILGI